MSTVGISEFRASKDIVLQRVNKGEVIALTARGAEAAKLVPPDFAQAATRQQLKQLRANAVVGDVLSPLNDPWKAADRCDRDNLVTPHGYRLPL